MLENKYVQIAIIAVVGLIMALLWKIIFKSFTNMPSLKGRIIPGIISLALGITVVLLTSNWMYTILTILIVIFIGDAIVMFATGKHKTEQ